MNRAELDLEREHLDLLDELAAAKESGDRQRRHDAAQAITAFRIKWRTIREAFATPTPGVATPATVNAGTTTPKVG